MTNEFKYIGPNYLLKKEGFSISYLPAGKIGISMFDCDGGGQELGGETALCFDGKYYILNGDHREAYAPMSKEDAVRYFSANQNLRSGWSDTMQTAERN